MRFYRCKCGSHTAWSSMGTMPCDGCDECHTTLAESPSGHQAIAPHDWEERFTVNEKSGQRAKERVCTRCNKREPVVFMILVDQKPVAIQAVDVTAGQIMAMAMIDPTWSLLREDVPAPPLPYDLPFELREGMKFYSAPPGHF